MNEAVRCLKPGGMILIVEGDFELVKSDMVTAQDMHTAENPGGSWLRRFYHGKLTVLYPRSPNSAPYGPRKLTYLSLV